MTAHPPPPVPQAAPWSPAQLVRLENEWRRLQRAYAYHPLVRVVPLEGDPPSQYQVEYQVRTLAINELGQLAYLASCPVHIWLPPQFPHAPPVVRPVEQIFHPNFTMDWVHQDPPWDHNRSLVDLVRAVGQMLAFQAYDPDAAFNPAAMDWVNAYPHLLPTDPAANFAPEAGGDALGRICRFGAATVEQYRKEFNDLCDNMLAGLPGTGSLDVQQFGRRMSMSAGLFAEADVPDHLRAVASELDEWARSMQGPRTVWDDLRRQYADTRAAHATRAQVAESEQALRKAVADLEAMTTAAPVADPLDTAGLIPPVPKLDVTALALKKTLRDAELRVTRLRQLVGSLTEVRPQSQGLPGGYLHTRLAADIPRGAAAAAEALEAGKAALASATPVLERAQVEAVALAGVTAWAAYTDLLYKGALLVKRCKDLNAAGIQAYFIENAAGKFGPYQFEERVDLGTVLAARRIGAGPVEVYDARNNALLGKGEGGVRVSVRGESGQSYETNIRPTDHTDELHNQLSYLITQLRTMWAGLAVDKPAPGRDAPSWCGRFLTALTSPESVAVITDSRRRTGQVWKALLTDLVAVGRFKERLATYHLLERLAEFVPFLLKHKERAHAAIDEANERLAHVGSRSQRDVETDQLIVPHSLLKEYQDNLHKRARGEQEIVRADGLVAAVAGDLRRRIAAPRLYGGPEVPVMKVLPALPEDLAALGPSLTDQYFLGRIRQLEKLTGMSLRVATASAAVAAPAEAEADADDTHY